jgi:hypothetical protein
MNNLQPLPDDNSLTSLPDPVSIEVEVASLFSLQLNHNLCSGGRIKKQDQKAGSKS